jgi:hypothetical protein
MHLQINANKNESFLSTEVTHVSPLALAREEQTYKRITVNMTDVPKKKTSVNIEEDTGNNCSSLSLRSTDRAGE